MNTNRDASQFTKYNNAKTLAAYYQARVNDINTGNLIIAPGYYSDISSKTYTDLVISKTECCIPTNIITISTGPTYTPYVDSFKATGSITWTAPLTCQSPITYWIVGGGGGGGAAYDNAGGGGGGGGFAITGKYAVVPGTTYTIVVGAGGSGGTARGTNSSPPNQAGSQTDGTAGTDSSFDSINGGPVAAGGGVGLRSRNNPGGSGLGGGVSEGGNGGGGGKGGGGGGGAGGNGTNSSGPFSAGLGGTGISLTVPGPGGETSKLYGVGGDGGANKASGYTVGASGSANTGKGGGGGGAASYQPPYAGGLISMGGEGGSGLVVIKYLIEDS